MTRPRGASSASAPFLTFTNDWSSYRLEPTPDGKQTFRRKRKESTTTWKSTGGHSSGRQTLKLRPSDQNSLEVVVVDSTELDEKEEDEEEEEEELIRVNLGLSHPLFEAEKRTTMSEDALGEFELPGRAT